ncbi:MAG: hypothetical protein B9S34_04405 [Opitutia bacterium Tous-C1TDCM]|nr:MAG: hypothetical protein B9S34_04405 [Opitutae bacterium Tous-C1TDCM]
MTTPYRFLPCRLLFAVGCVLLAAAVGSPAPLRAAAADAVGKPGLVWLETENFKQPGGWTKDWQFIDQMGSPYLMAIGYGSPVADATTTVERLPAGRYRLWARTNDWVPQHHPGKFEIKLNGRSVPMVFGASGRDGWTWEDGGVHALEGDVAVALHDLQGYYGRCDVVVLARDPDWVPPAGKTEIAALRLAHGALSAEIHEAGTYDVVVVGGGIAGTFAAVSAARQGAKTMLIQNRALLGGNASTENLVPPVGAMQNRLTKEQIELDPRETGLIEEVNLYGRQRYFEVGRYWPSRLQLLAEAEPNLVTRFLTEATGVELRDGEIAAVLCTEIETGRRLRIRGRLFVDATGNAVVGLWAGAQAMYGKEPKAMYNETKAPDTASDDVLGSSLKYWYTKANGNMPFAGPAWAYPFHQCSDFGTIRDRHPSVAGIDTQWVIELGGTGRTYEKAEATRDDLIRLIYGLWDHVKNHCKDPVNADAAKLQLAWVGHVVGMRESFRLLGDYVMVESDVTKQPLLDDRVAYGGWGLDDHPSLGFFDKTRLKNHTHGGLLFSVPYRSLYSANIPNLMMAGRNISVTHVALTATRVMLTTGTIGQAVGTAAGMCIAKDVKPRAIYQRHLEELQQQLLKDGAYLIELPNLDPRDLARKATASASSEKAPAREAVNGYSRARFPTTTANATMRENAWLPDPAAAGEQWLQLAWDSPQPFNVVHVVFQNRGKLAPRKFRLEARVGGAWRTVADVANADGARRLVLPVGKVEGDALRVVLTENIHYHGGICEVRVYRETEAAIEQIKSINRVVATPLGEVPLPWER